MLLGRILSPANPIQGSTHSTYGYKPAETIIARSVGDIAGDNTYVARDESGSLPTFVLEDGTLTFSCPQTHPYIGIGDYVTGPNVYLTRKISTRQWEARSSDGSVPTDATGSVARIDKAYSNLIDALSGTQADIGADIESNGYTVYLACYEKSSYTSNTIDITGWTTTTREFIKIYTPTDVAKECNKSQRHTHSSDGFVIQSNAVTTLIQCSDDNVLIEGLHLQLSGACTNGIDVQGAGVVSDCKIKDFTGCGILVTETTDDVVVARNIVHGSSGVGIKATASSKVIQNTVYGYPTGYQFLSPTANTYCANCLAANNATNGFVTPPTAFYNSASDDATATGTNCVTSAALDFYDAANGDFRLTNANNTSVLDAALDLSTYSLFAISEDIEGNPVDNTPTMGSMEMVRVVPYAIGDTSTDVKTAANISISNGIVTFSSAQTNDRLASGDVLTHASGSCILTEKVDSTHWRSTTAAGLAPADVAGPSAITSILPQFQSVALFIAGATPKDLVTNDIQIELVCVEDTGLSDTPASFSGYTCDETRGISIYAPVAGGKCNSNRRHVGVWDGSLMYFSSLSVDSTGGYIDILGTQFTDDLTIENARNRVEACILDGGGINVKPESGEDCETAILSNIIYDCSDGGIEVSNDNTTVGTYRFAIYNNTVYNCAFGVSYEVLGTNSSEVVNNIRLLNNLLIANSTDILGDDPRSDNCTSESNWTSDSTGLSLLLERNNDALRTVIFNGSRDFHIPFAQQILMIGYAANVDHFYQAYIDIDSGTRPETYYNEPYGWSIGADQYSLPSKSVAYFSVGHDASNLQSGSTNVSVVGGIATFDVALDSSIGIGDKVTTSGHTLYLAEKGSSTEWRVVDSSGATISDFTSESVTDIKRVSNDLATAMSTDVAAEFGSTDLVASTAEVKVECYQDDASADTAAVTVSGWTTSETYCLTIESPFDTITQCGSRQRHSGVWSTSRYRIETSAAVAISVSNQYVHIDGLQIIADSSTGVAFSSAGGSTVKRCVIKDSTNGVTQDTNAYVIYVKSNIVYDTTTIGIDIKNGYGDSNTVVTDNGTAHSTQASATLINNIAQGSGTGYSGGGTITNCISEDGTGTVTSVTLSFAGSGDYHLARDDFEALNEGFSSFYAPNRPTRDIDSELIYEYSIGADCQDLETVQQTFSCGRTTANLSQGLSGLAVSVSGNVAVFSMDVSNIGIIIGDTLTYDTSKIAYLKEKLSDTSWTIVTHVGEAPESAASAVVNSIKRTFNYVESVFRSSQSSSVAQFPPYGSASHPMTDLTKAKLQVSVALDRTAGNGEPAIVHGFTTGEENYLRLYAPYEDSECYSTQRHVGVYDPTAIDKPARLIYSSTSTSPMITVYCNYTEIDGLVVARVKNATGNPTVYVEAFYCKVINNIVLNSVDGIRCLHWDYKTKIANNIVYNAYMYGIKCSLSDYVYNNTVDDCQYGIESDLGSLLVNNIAQNCSIACYSGIPNTYYCMADDTTLSGTGDLTSTDAEFEDQPNRDYNLTSDSPRGVGKQLAGDVVYPFSVDAANNDRGRLWDMGALEFQAAGTVYFSVGDTTQNYLTASALKSSVTGGVITFPVEQTNSKLMSGDKIMDGLSVIGYLGEKIDSTNWRITTALGVSPTNGQYSVSEIKRMFASLPDAFIGGVDSVVGTNLVGGEVQVNITVSNDAVSTTAYRCFIEDYTCDADYFIRIFSPIDITKYCNSPHRHKGNLDAGSEVVVNYAGPLLEISGTNYVEVSGVIFENTNAAGYGLRVDDSAWLLIGSNIVHDCEFKAIDCDFDTQDGTVNSIVNNILTNCQNGGISIEGDGVNRVWIMNNTIVNCGYGVYQIKGTGLSSVLYMYNNICQNNGISDFMQDHPENPNKFNLYYNISLDDTAGSLSHNISKRYINFVDRSGENFALDRVLDSIAINSALDLRDDSPYYFFEDCRGVDREEYQWDRGAIEQGDLIGSGSMQIGPLTISNQYGVSTDEFPTLILYLRNNLHPSVPLAYQFFNIPDLNAFLATDTIDNIVVYVEANESFDGTFEFYDRTAANPDYSRTVKVITDPGEATEGPASIRYEASGLFDDASNQGSLTFENLKIYGVDTSSNTYLNETNAALTDSLIFINCIVQVNRDSLVNSSTVVELVNSIVLYFNTNDVSIMYLAKNSLIGHKNFNSLLIADGSVDLKFRTCYGALTDYVYNSLTHNIGTGDFDFDISASRLKNCLENEDPLFTEIERFYDHLIDPPDVIEQSNFKPLITSPVANTGYDAVVSLYSITTDIEGNSRQFQSGLIDMGPYELEIHIFTLSSSDVRAIDQIRIDIDRENKRLICLENNTVYSDLYSTFQYNQGEMEEFLREKKVAIQLKSEPTIILNSDKVLTTIEEFEAYYDAESMTIVITKTNDESPFILGKMLDDDTYSLYFNEQDSKLTLLFNEAMTLCLSGTSNPVNNVRFGGTPTFNQ